MRRREAGGQIPYPLASTTLVLALTLALGACGDTPGEPVGSLVAEPAELDLGHGTAVDVMLRFEPTVELGGEGQPFVFVHLLDSRGEVVLTADHALGSDWQPGRAIDDPVRLFHSALAPALPAGEYRLTAGLFRDDRRWSLNAGEEVARQEYQVARVTVPEAGRGQPKFSDDWMPVNLGADRQVVARRWLAADGTITVEVPEGGGSLALVIRIPEPAEGQQLVFAEGETSPRVTVLARCTGQKTSFGGVGPHRVDLSLERSVRQEEDLEIVETNCPIALAANYQLVDTKTFAKAVLILEQLAWVVDGDQGAG